MDRAMIEAIYPLSPLQQGLLFHTLQDPGSGLYVEQFSSSLGGALDAAAWERAWERVVERHAVLRTAFLWEGRDQPLQIASRAGKTAWERDDWRALPREEQRERLSAYLDADLRRGFDLARLPLMRMALFRTADDAWEFVWSHHHVLLDGWSVARVLEEVFRFYEAFLRGGDLSLPVPRPYRDYVVWLRKQDLHAAEAFWRDELRGVQAPTPLGVDRPARGSRHAGPECFGEERLDLPGAATEALHALARRQRVTVSTIVQGAWALLLSCYSGEEDVVFGATVSGRPPELPGVEEMVGLFINTLPVRARVAPGATLGDWLRTLHARQVERHPFEHAPLVEVHGWSEIPRDRPLFESLLIYENFPTDPSVEEASVGLEIREFHAVETTGYPLTLVAQLSGGLALRALYDTRRLDAQGVRRALGHLRTLLEEMGRRPDARVRDLSPVGAEEREVLLRCWNDTARDFAREERVHDRFQTVAARTPDAPALLFEGVEVTYGELNRRANRLAHHLAALGVGAEARVGVLLERGEELVVALLAVLKAGGAYVPLDPAYPAERTGYVLEDAGVRAVITDARLAERAAAPGAAVVRVDADRGAIAARSDGDPATPASSRNLAYVLYTSGSTGRPKGVMVPHRALVNFLDSMRQKPGLSAGDTLLAVTTVSFDIAGLELFLPLTTGARVALATREDAADGARLRALLAATGATVMQATPATWQMLLDAGWEGTAGLRVLCGGEALPRELAERLLPRCAALWNVYGPTETTIWSTALRVEPGEGPVAIGYPVANTTAHLLDGELRPVPLGAAGELYLGGEGVARGYLRRPDLTAERFVPDPFPREAGARLYRTGDRARRRADGALEFLGRADHQLKVRGHRIEPGEIEAALHRHPAVREAVVVAWNGDERGVRLVAYVGADEGAVTEDALAAHLGELLPEYMVPSIFVLLPALPRTPNGKTDRAALPAPRLSGQGGEHVPPRTETEQVLAAIWAEVLGVERVGTHDSFFRLGGHSLLATQAVSRVRTRLDVELPVHQIFDTPVLSRLAAVVDGMREEKLAALLAEIDLLSDEEAGALLAAESGERSPG